MLVWRSTDTAGHRCPPWLEDADGRFASSATGEGATLWTPAKYRDMLAMRTDAEWEPCAREWEVAQYQPIDPSDYLRDMPDAGAIQVRDVTDAVWMVPAILRPDGAPAVGMRNVVDFGGDGQVRRVPANPRTAAALQAAQEARPYAECDWNGVDAAQMLAWMLACLECVYHINGGSLGVLGLVGDTLLDKGMRMVCGVLKAAELQEADG